MDGDVKICGFIIMNEAPPLEPIQFLYPETFDKYGMLKNQFGTTYQKID